MGYYKNIEMNGIVLPEEAPKGGTYAKFTSTAHGTIYYSSGVGCKYNGDFLHKGHVGKEVSVEQAREAAEQCILNVVSNMHEELGDLNRVKKILKLTGFVNSADDFYSQPLVMDAASDLLIKIFGPEAGICARTSVGVNVLPGNQAVEVEIVFEVM